MPFRYFFLAGLVFAGGLSATAFSQTPPAKRLTKTEIDAKFHRPAVKAGTTGVERLRQWEKRLALQAESPFAAILWRNIGPTSQGGRVIQIAAPASAPDSVYVAFATGGLWRTEDDGITFTSLFDNQSSYSIGDFALGKDGQTIWVGTGENNSQRTSYGGTGVFKSQDAGKTWKNMGLPESNRIGRVLIDPRNENVVYVAVLGNLYSQNEERGLYKTLDGGKTWTRILKGNEYTGVIDVEMEPGNPDVLYAATWERDRRSWNFREGGPGSALHKSTNGGKTWAKLGGGLPDNGEVGRIGIAISPAKPKTVYAFIDNQGPDALDAQNDERIAGGQLTVKRFQLLDEDMLLAVDKKVLEPFWKQRLPEDFKLDDALAKLKDKKLTMLEIREQMLKRNPNVFTPEEGLDELYRSDDAGKTWHRTHRSRIGGFGGYYWGKVFANPRNADDVVVAGLPLLRSKDGGASFQEIAGDNHVDHHAVWFDPRNPNKLWNGNDGGLYLSGDDGKSWRHLNNLAVGQLTTIAVDMKTPYNVYGGLQDNGTMKGPSNFRLDRPGGPFGSGWTTIGWGDGSAIAVDPRDGGDVVYTASQFGSHSAQNQKTGQRWGARAGSGRRYNWVSPLIISSHHPDIVYLGSEKVHRSFDQGRAYVDISGDLSKNRPNGNVPFSTAKDLSESPLQFGLVYVGYDDGTVKMTPDGGHQWIDIPTPQPNKWVSRIVASKHEKTTVYCAQSGYREDDLKAYLWKSEDFGKTWKSIVGNLPDETINVVREDPENENILYVGTDLGVWITFDGGEKWESLNGGIPITPVHDLVVQPREKELVIASHARSAWVLPLKTVLSLTDEIREKPLTVFPADSVRVAANLPYRVRADYDLRDVDSPKFKTSFFTQSAGEAKLRLKDKAGKVVKEVSVTAVKGFNFADFELRLKDGKAGSTKFTPSKPSTVDDALKDPYAGERSAYVAAGDYKLEIQIGAERAEVDVKVTGG